MANNANQLTPSPTAENISSPTIKLVPLFIYSPAPERKYMTLSCAPNPSCSRFALPIRLNISSISPIRCHPTCRYLSQSKLTLHHATDYRSSSTDTAAIFVTPKVPPTYGATVPSPFSLGGPQHHTPSSLSLDSEDLINWRPQSLVRRTIHFPSGNCDSTMVTLRSGINGLGNLKAP